jgi:hypothetical protein
MDGANTQTEDEQKIQDRNDRNVHITCPACNGLPTVLYLGRCKAIYKQEVVVYGSERMLERLIRRHILSEDIGRVVRRDSDLRVLAVHPDVEELRSDPGCSYQLTVEFNFRIRRSNERVLGKESPQLIRQLTKRVGTGRRFNDNPEPRLVAE